jgi:hypothetical protein
MSTSTRTGSTALDAKTFVLFHSTRLSWLRVWVHTLTTQVRILFDANLGVYFLLNTLPPSSFLLNTMPPSSS